MITKEPLPQLTLLAPLDGVVVPLEQVPDAVFAGKMVGDGIAIDPTSQTLLSPCDGTISRIYPTFHAITLISTQGVEVFIHIGLDTVLLRGEGFLPLVSEHQQVSAGTPLIEFDADKLACSARSLLTLILFTQPQQIMGLTSLSDAIIHSGEPLIQAQLNSSIPQAPVELSYETFCSDWVPLLNPSGLHARPSALFTAQAQQFSSQITLRTASKSANALSVVALMGLNTRQGDLVQIEATGPDAKLAIDALLLSIAEGLGEPVAGSGHMLPEEPPLLAQISADANLLLGVSASPGAAIGPVIQFEDVSFEYAEKAHNPAQQHKNLKQAMSQVSLMLEGLVAEKIAQNKPEQADIFQLHIQLLADPELKTRARSLINQGKSAPFAFSRAISEQEGTLRQLNNPFLACRASDLQDLRQHVLRQLLGKTKPKVGLTEPCIVIASELTPSMAANLDPSRVIGLATTGGGASSHGAILARSMGIPAVVAIDKQAQQIANGTHVILDGTAGNMRINLSHQQISDLQNYQQQQTEQYRRDKAKACDPATTTDGHSVEVVANIANLQEAEHCIPSGAEGIGLLRTELLFLERCTAPTEDEQTELYGSILELLAGKPVIIRTLDVGGDKPLPYITQPRETNPFLGERGIRIGLNHPALLRTQIRAILRAAQAQQCSVRIMFPMVATLEEFRAAKQLVQQEATKLDHPHYELGLMVEVPATALMAEAFAEEADFLSIGSNDLTQYTLAMDRSQPSLAARMDGLNPAILRLIQLTITGAHKAGKWVGLCGDMASDPQAVPLLLGLGLDELSVAVPSLPVVKRQIRGLCLAECQALAEQALGCKTANQVRALRLPCTQDGATL